MPDRCCRACTGVALKTYTSTNDQTFISQICQKYLLNNCRFGIHRCARPHAKYTNYDDIRTLRDLLADANTQYRAQQGHFGGGPIRSNQTVSPPRAESTAAPSGSSNVKTGTGTSKILLTKVDEILTRLTALEARLKGATAVGEPMDTSGDSQVAALAVGGGVSLTVGHSV
ncbi:hypothetical protein HDU93_008313 [Gonapodya sp. JEL0774]|nr:hypothetical protein HDU93_008313 [Gonapodya sp. JEL0774]